MDASGTHVIVDSSSHMSIDIEEERIGLYASFYVEGKGDPSPVFIDGSICFYGGNGSKIHSHP